MFFLKNHVSARASLLFLVDSILILIPCYLALGLKLGRYSRYNAPWWEFLAEAIFITILCQLIFLINDLYDLENKLGLSDVIVRIIIAFAVCSLILSIFYFVFPSLGLSQGFFLYSLLIALGLIICWRVIFGWLFNRLKYAQRIIIYGSGSTAQMIAHEIAQYGNPLYRVEGFADDNPEQVGRKIMGLKVYNAARDLPQIVTQKKIDKIVVALNQRRGVFPVNTLLKCKLKGTEVVDLPDFYEKLTGKILIKDLRPSWLIFSPGFHQAARYRSLKRALDIVFSIIGLILASPIMLITAILIKLDSPGPVLFRQERVGGYGKPFILMKFRSMYADAEEGTGPVWAQENDQRITRVGRIIRKLRIDELPQMINVLKGEMSFVGPRPERPYFIKKLQERVPYYTQRLMAKPGITGWAAVKFQYSSNIEGAVEKLQYDLYYIKNISLTLDLLIILKTIQVIITGKGSR